MYCVDSFLSVLGFRLQNAIQVVSSDLLHANFSSEVVSTLSKAMNELIQKTTLFSATILTFCDSK